MACLSTCSPRVNLLLSDILEVGMLRVSFFVDW